jgi:ribosomal protein L16 Arg81 hydroxylase
MVLAGGATNDYYLVANNGFFDRPEALQLASEAPVLPEYLDHSDRQGQMFLWFGPAGTITPLHHDLMNVMIAQIYGRKRFTLIPPEQTAYVYNNAGVYGEVDCAKPDYSKHALYGEARPVNFVLTPGDVLFLPVGWWHYVKALDVSIMVSYINFKFPNHYSWSNPDFGWR